MLLFLKPVTRLLLLLIFMSVFGVGKLKAQSIIPGQDGGGINTQPNSNSSPANQESVEVERYTCNVPTESNQPPRDILIEISGISVGNNPFRQIKITGSTVFDSADFQAAISSLIDKNTGQNLTRNNFLIFTEQLAQSISSLYQNSGYITSIARVESHSNLVLKIVSENIVEIHVTEGSLKEINVEVNGSKRLNQSYICSRILQGVTVPLNTNQLEDRLRLLRSDSHLEFVDAKLRAAGERGKSNLIVAITESSPFEVNLSADNYSPPSVGSERVGIGFLYRNLTGLGDDLTGSYHFSTTGGVELFDAKYEVPINSQNGTISLRTSLNRNEITDPKFEELGIRGNTELYEIFYRQPLIRNFNQELALSLGFTFQEGQTFIFDNEPSPFGEGPDKNGFSRTSVFKFGQEYLRRDSRGVWNLRSLFNIGTGLFDATINPGSIPDGRFFSWSGQAQRLQPLSQNNFLIISADLQLTPDSLLASQQFVIGGGQSLRGYRQNARSGDNGFRFSVEDRVILERNKEGNQTILLVPFFDMGAVWNVSDNPNELPEQRFLMGAGVGLIWNDFADINGLNLRLDYGIPFIDLKDRGYNAQDDGFYFGVNYRVVH